MINDKSQNEIIISELDIKRLDNKFKTKSKYFPQTNTIFIETQLDSWKIKLTNKKVKGIHLYHMNKRGQRNRFHYQASKTSVYDAYDSIYNHRSWMSVVKTSNTTYEGLNI